MRTFLLFLLTACLPLPGAAEIVIDSLVNPVTVQTGKGLIVFGIIRSKSTDFDIRLLDTTLRTVKRRQMTISPEPVTLSWVQTGTTLTISGENGNQVESFVFQYNTSDLSLNFSYYIGPGNRNASRERHNGRQGPASREIRTPAAGMLAADRFIMAVDRDTFDYLGNPTGRLRTLLRQYHRGDSPYSLFSASWETELEPYATDNRVIHRGDGQVWVFQSDSAGNARCLLSAYDETNGTLLWKTPLALQGNPALFFSHCYYDRAQQKLLIAGAYSARPVAVSETTVGPKKTLSRTLNGSFCLLADKTGKIVATWKSETFFAGYECRFHGGTDYSETWPCTRVAWIGVNTSHEFLVVFEDDYVVPGYTGICAEGAIHPERVGVMRFSRNLELVQLDSWNVHGGNAFSLAGLGGTAGKKITCEWPVQPDMVRLALRDTVHFFVAGAVYDPSLPSQARLLFHAQLTNGIFSLPTWMYLKPQRGKEPPALFVPFAGQTFGDVEQRMILDRSRLYRIRTRGPQLVIDVPAW